MASTDRHGWARVPPALAWKQPGLPTAWTRVLDEMPADMLYPLPPGYVLLDARKDRPLRAWAAHLEFRDTPALTEGGISPLLTARVPRRISLHTTPQEHTRRKPGPQSYGSSPPPRL